MNMQPPGQTTATRRPHVLCCHTRLRRRRGRRCRMSRPAAGRPGRLSSTRRSRREGSAGSSSTTWLAGVAGSPAARWRHQAGHASTLRCRSLCCACATRGLPPRRFVPALAARPLRSPWGGLQKPELRHGCPCRSSGDTQVSSYWRREPAVGLAAARPQAAMRLRAPSPGEGGGGWGVMSSRPQTLML